LSHADEHPGFIAATGAAVIGFASYLGGMALLLGSTLRWLAPTLLGSHGRAGRAAVATQLVRVGVRATGIVCLVQLFIGVILALQMAPPLENPYHQSQMVASIIGVAGFRMLGPIITAVVLSGFAGASIAAELGTMVVAEEIEALTAHALNPVRFLVVPRVVATFIAMIMLTVVADWMIALGGYAISVVALPSKVSTGYWDRMRDQVLGRDFASGLVLGAVFGVVVALIACYEGLRVAGGAEGVGKATTMTVVNGIVGIIGTACMFTMVFYVFGF
jgi:phospholipid/cholesterol/gamma-HCH transport system permease protein